MSNRVRELRPIKNWIALEGKSEKPPLMHFLIDMRTMGSYEQVIMGQRKGRKTSVKNKIIKSRRVKINPQKQQTYLYSMIIDISAVGCESILK